MPLPHVMGIPTMEEAEAEVADMVAEDLPPRKGNTASTITSACTVGKQDIASLNVQPHQTNALGTPDSVLPEADLYQSDKSTPS